MRIPFALWNHHSVSLHWFCSTKRSLRAAQTATCHVLRGCYTPKNTWRAKNAEKVTRYRLLSLLAAQPADCRHACQTKSQISISTPNDKEAGFSQIAERHVTVARCDVRSALSDQQEVNLRPKAARCAASSYKQC